MFQPTGQFTVESWTSSPVQAPWAIETAVAPSYQADEALKKAFGIELARASNAFEAACVVAEDDTSKALWISSNWICDPVVEASKDAYLKTLALSSPPLDKEQLAAKVLALAEEKILKGGIPIPSIEAKDRIAAFKLYSEIMGYTGKVEIDNSSKTFTHNEMTIKLVKAETPVTINHTPNINASPNIKSENEEFPSPITLKLVGGASR